jgi:ABC-type multidrug transport system ATPase subunit
VIVILSTHIVEDVTDLCTSMAILHQGRVLFRGRPDEAVGELEGRVWKTSIPKSELAAWEERHRVVSSRLVAGRPLLHVLADQPPGPGFEPSAPDLEDVFFTKIRGWA